MSNPPGLGPRPPLPPAAGLRGHMDGGRHSARTQACHRGGRWEAGRSPPPGRPPPGLAFGPLGRPPPGQKRRGRRRGRLGPAGRPRARAYPVGRRLGHGCPSLAARGSSRRPVGPGAARWRRRRRRSGAAQPRSPSPAAASCVRATCPAAGPLNKSCARGRARGRAQRPLQPEGPHVAARSPPSRRPRGPPAAPGPRSGRRRRSGGCGPRADAALQDGGV